MTAFFFMGCFIMWWSHE